ncbi:hypothetical protein ACHAWF_003910 [Thalassiosira exigua]
MRRRTRSAPMAPWTRSFSPGRTVTISNHADAQQTLEGRSRIPRGRTLRWGFVFVLFLFLVTVTVSNYIYFVKMPIWSYEEEWVRWEEGMRQVLADSIPPLLSDANATQVGKDWSPDYELLDQFPRLKQKVRNIQSGEGGAGDDRDASEYVVPVPDYELIGRIRGKMAQNLREHAIQSCQSHERYHDEHFLNAATPRSAAQNFGLPVIGITVATDTPENRYLRRLLHTIDLQIVDSIVVTWYDEQTEAQLVGDKNVGLSHEVIDQALSEFISRMEFTEIPWEKGFPGMKTGLDGNSTTSPVSHGSSNESTSGIRLADTSSLKLMSQIATSIQQYCRFQDEQIDGHGFDTSSTRNSSKSECRNELIILRFPTNLGCSSGVNNPLFTHPSASHWLISNYDIAYPPGVMRTMRDEFYKTIIRKPNLAVHTFGYIYGRGKLENPWSNFVMTSCAVANVGVWDEDLFPAYYEDDDFRDRIRYIMGKWSDEIGVEDVPQYLMGDGSVIHYQTDRHVAVAHGPLDADTYLSGTHETMQRVQDEEADQKLLEAQNKKWKVRLLNWLCSWISLKELVQPEKPQNPFYYESHRWKIVKNVSDSEGVFRCKHGALPDRGEFGEDPLRYFAWNERFILPFINRTRSTRHEDTFLNGKDGIDRRESPWANWTFNATRRRCVHDAANIILSMPPSQERDNLTAKLRASCSVC